MLQHFYQLGLEMLRKLQRVFINGKVQIGLDIFMVLFDERDINQSKASGRNADQRKDVHQLIFGF